ncbi:MAG: hypothetical protein JRI68_24260 [Deltaproteobacteria bacterium]|nr:hypothetical protein [Deltaproteobacteria bacterium]
MAGTAVTTVTAALAVGCLDRPLEPIDPRTTSTVVERLTHSRVDKIDLLLVIDNSGSMADKQAILAGAVPDLVGALVNPPCVGDDGQRLPMAGPLEPCPAGMDREFDPIADMHVGIISSSLGSHGSDQCTGTKHESENDQAHLLVRSGVGADDPPVNGLDGHSFLVWDPESDDDTADGTGAAATDEMIQTLSEMVSGVGEVGCGYEAPFEAWYRFLVEPNPHASITVVDGIAQLEGTDQQLLAERGQFLRPDSMLAVIMLTDENDCSIRDGGYNFIVAQNKNGSFHLPRPRAACATDPNDPCCRSCAQPPGDGCDTSQDECDLGNLEPIDDSINLRCFDQKRRFGVDFLWPIERYLTGLTAQTVADRDGAVVKNPLFTDLNPDDDNATLRDPSLVFIAGIVGVPWQDIARRDAAGKPDLLAGLDTDGNPVGGFQSGEELEHNRTWELILGDPATQTAPTDPLMIESVDPRSGIHPVTGEPLALPGSGWQHSVNGSEYSLPNRNDLQYACIFPLEPFTEPRDCSVTGTNCDCSKPDNDKPLCEPNPNDGGQPTLQTGAKAYPGVRELQLLRDAGAQGIVGSICPRQLDAPAAADFGYRPAIGAIVERLKQALGPACLPRSLEPNAEGQVACLVVEASLDEACACDGAARRPIATSHPAVQLAKEDPNYSAAGWGCFCEIVQTSGEALQACQNNADDHVTDSAGNPVDGWCYVDATTLPPTGNPALVDTCPATQERRVRFVGEGEGAPGATLFITCAS